MAPSLLTRAIEGERHAWLEALKRSRILGVQAEAAVVPLLVKWLRAAEERDAIVVGASAPFQDAAEWVAGLLARLEDEIATLDTGPAGGLQGLDPRRLAPLAPGSLRPAERFAAACERLARFCEPLGRAVIVAIQMAGDRAAQHAFLVAAASLMAHPSVHIVAVETEEPRLIAPRALDSVRRRVVPADAKSIDDALSDRRVRVVACPPDARIERAIGRRIAVEVPLDSRLGFARATVEAVARAAGAGAGLGAPGAFPYEGVLAERVESIVRDLRGDEAFLIDITVSSCRPSLVAAVVRHLTECAVDPAVRYVIRLPAAVALPQREPPGVAVHPLRFDAGSLRDLGPEIGAAPPRERFQAHMVLAGIAIKGGDEEESHAESQKAIAAAREAADPALEAMGFVNLGNAFLRGRHHGSAAGAYSKARDVALGASQPAVAALATVQLGHAQALDGRLDDAAASYKEAAEYYERVGMIEPGASARMHLGDACERKEAGSGLAVYSLALETLERHCPDRERSGHTRTQLCLRLDRAFARAGNTAERDRMRQKLKELDAEAAVLVEIG